MMKVVLNECQKNILREKVLTNELRLRKIVESSSPTAPGSKKYTLILQEDDADLIRDLCGKNLQLYGFDKKYQPTKEGRLLEELIDILYVK